MLRVILMMTWSTLACSRKMVIVNITVEKEKDGTKAKTSSMKSAKRKKSAKNRKTGNTEGDIKDTDEVKVMETAFVNPEKVTYKWKCMKESPQKSSDDRMKTNFLAPPEL